ncbi:hypothetical protein [Stenotrophomonas sp.]|uniref:hypothetical protein n=1 Tax=Stenotrophomonas sp. TaxID=69392 RepID=UPI0028980C83|nr:hypothetical protein [Stenotrophomonas sp.]
MRTHLALVLAVALSLPVAAQPTLPPMQQLDYPVLAVGDTGQFRVQIPAYAGGQGRVSYAAHALMPGSSVDLGYRFTAAECGEGFTPYVHYNDRGVVCSRFGEAPHAAFEMVVTVRNVGAAEGEALMPEGLGYLVYDLGSVTAPWRLYGVRP